MIVNIVKDALTGGASSQPGSLLFQHPEYRKRWWWWEFNRVSYKGGREYYQPARLSVDFQYPLATSKLNEVTGVPVYEDAKQSVTSLLFRHSREKSFEFANRRQRAYYHNFPRTVVNSLVSHTMRNGPRRTVDPMLMEFHNAVDVNRTETMDQFMTNGLRWAQVKGLMWGVMDVRPPPLGDGKPYAYWVSPLDILDWEVDSDGKLVWVKQFVYAEKARNWDQAIETRFRFRIWRRDGVETYETDAAGSGMTVVPGMTRKYTIGRVPLEPLFSTKDEECHFPDGTPLVGDLCKGANNVFNWSSLLSEIIYKQTFSWLSIPVKNVDTTEMGVSTAFGYDASQTNGAKPEYLSPDPQQPRVIIEAIADCIEQMRQSVGVGRGRSESSKSPSTEGALQIETEDKRTILSDIATEAMSFERRFADLHRAYRLTGATSAERPSIIYGPEFDTRSLMVEVNEVLSMQKVKLSPEVNLEMAMQLVHRKFAGMEPKKRDALVESLRSQQEKDLAAAEALAKTGAQQTRQDGEEPGDDHDAETPTGEPNSAAA